MIDARTKEQSVWTLSAHSEGINGMTISSKGMLITGSSDKTMKVWDIRKEQPSFVFEKQSNIGLVHSLEGCPDAPFTIALGGDNPSHNLHVMDVRESASGKHVINNENWIYYDSKIYSTFRL